MTDCFTGFQLSLLCLRNVIDIKKIYINLNLKYSYLSDFFLSEQGIIGILLTAEIISHPMNNIYILKVQIYNTVSSINLIFLSLVTATDLVFFIQKQ